MSNSRKTMIQKHFTELSNQYSGLTLVEGDYGTWIVRGLINFSATYNGITIRDKFKVEIYIPEDYPDVPPSITEKEGHITNEFHINPDGTLCLGAPLDVRMKFAKQPSLMGFVSKQVVPFLFSFCYWQQHGEMPFGALSHGGKGLLEYYVQVLNVTSDIIALRLLKVLAENNYRGHHNCPCGSGNRLRNCHGKLLRKISTYQSQDEFLYDYLQCLTYLKESGRKLQGLPISKKLIKRIKKYSQRYDKNEKRGVQTLQDKRMN